MLLALVSFFTREWFISGCVKFFNLQEKIDTVLLYVRHPTGYIKPGINKFVSIQTTSMITITSLRWMDSSK